MDLSRIPLFEALTKRMGWLGERQGVLAQNIANADTPGYVAKDLAPPDFSRLVAGASQRLAMATSDPADLPPASGQSAYRQIAQRIGERAPDGNAVQLEDQMMKVSDTANDYALTTSLYAKHIGLLKLVLGKSGG
jgi:flagellar basal-body rod protein FlgB